MSKIVLIDGHSILNRAFFGMPNLTNSKGFHTGAIYGFLNILFRILEEEQPEFLTVAFDEAAPTFRHKIYKAYKGTRKPMPQELREQVPVIKDVLSAMNICIVSQPGLEADDILATIALQAEKDGLAVSLVSGDRDLLQVASDVIKIRIPKTKGGRSEIEDYHAEDVKRVYQIEPARFIDLKALMGDSSDNIPGVPKIGEKTATQLLVQYGSLDAIYGNLSDIEKVSVKNTLAENKELADLSYRLATINTAAQTNFSYEQAKIGDFYNAAAYALFKELEFKNHLSRFDVGRFDGAQDEARQADTLVLEDLSAVERCFAALLTLAAQSYVGIYPLCDSSSLYGVAISAPNPQSPEEINTYYIPRQGFVTADYLGEKLRLLAHGLRDKHIRMATFDIKNKYDFFLEASIAGTEGVAVTAAFFDILIAAYLLNPLKNDYQAEDIADEHLGQTLETYEHLFGKMPLPMAALQTEIIAKYAGAVARTAYLSAPILMEKLKEAGMEALFNEMEMPLSHVLGDMEKIGILVEPQQLKEYGETLSGRIAELEELIYGQAGIEFNLNSPKQLSDILFNQMNLPGGKKTKTGYSTAADVLEQLAPKHPIIKDILEYRGLAKLKSTYADGLFAYIAADERIRTHLKQTITATGRLSSADPNLQNIPMRTPLGRLIRKVFIATPGYSFVSADYSQIELRVLAHMSEDDQLIAAYHMEEDIHRATAAKVFDVPLKEVTQSQRSNAKAVNFGIVYGISSFGLSQDLTISVKEAEGYISQYFATYPQVKTFLDETVEQAKAQGYVTTLFGRRRPVPELNSSVYSQRSFGERVAMNTPIQGTAADIIKIAMIRVWDRLKKAGLRSRLILQIHDELLLEAAVDEVETVKAILMEEMMGAAQLLVALEVSMHCGEDWYECG